jgi:2-polyprenyl-3-methyl-5-hydroxy-6-metoxy-1,4-benzoquinol methylase
MWVDFARGMAPLRVPAADFIAKLVGADDQKPMKILDIAASHGMFGITIARRNPKAEIVAVDWKNVLGVAKENAAKAGVQNRYKTIAGSAFDVDFGTGYDVALVTAFLHHFDVPTNEKFLKKIHSALKPGGVVATLEFVPNEDRVTPPHAAGFALIMLSNTPAGDAYTLRELDQMFRNAGFSSSELHNNPNSLDQVLISTK